MTVATKLGQPVILIFVRNGDNSVFVDVDGKLLEAGDYQPEAKKVSNLFERVDPTEIQI